MIWLTLVDGALADPAAVALKSTAPTELPPLNLTAARSAADQLARTTEGPARALSDAVRTLYACFVALCPDESAPGRGVIRALPSDPFHQPYVGAVTSITPPEFSWYPFGPPEAGVRRVWLNQDGDRIDHELPAPTTPDARGLWAVDPRPSFPSGMPAGVWTLHVANTAGNVKTVTFFVDPVFSDPHHWCPETAPDLQLCLAIGWLAQDQMWEFEAVLADSAAESDPWMLRTRIRQWKNRLPLLQTQAAGDGP